MFFYQVPNYYLPTILLQPCMIGLLNRFRNHCANNVLCFFISKHGFFPPMSWRNIFAMHVNSTELMNVELNLLRDAPVVTSCSGGFPHTRRHNFHSAWPGSQALPPASSPWWVITIIPFTTPCTPILHYKLWGRETGPLQMYRYLHVAYKVLQQGKGAPEVIRTNVWSNLIGSEVKECLSFPRTITEFMAGQKKIVKGKHVHEKQRDGKVTPRAKDGVNNCTQTDSDLCLVFPAPSQVLTSASFSLNNPRGLSHGLGNYISSFLSFLHVSSPSLSRLLTHGYWSGEYRRNTSHGLDQPCWTVTGFIPGLYTLGNEVLIPLS